MSGALDSLKGAPDAARRRRWRGFGGMMREQGVQLDRAAIFRRAETIVAHDEPVASGAVVPPIHQTSLFTFADYETMARVFAGDTQQPVYSRGDNPTVMDFEARVAALEWAEAARAFSSGMAAISASVLSFAGAGDRIVCVRHVYGDAYRFFEKLLPRLNIRVDYIDATRAEDVIAAMEGARVVYLENPTSMVFDLQDVGRIAEAARARAIVTMLDNSWATPLFQQPHLHGIDLVLHSASKYLGGHSDVVAGVVAGSAAHIGRINDRAHPYLGAKLAPLEAFLLLRGLRTLPLRMERHERQAKTLAGRLAAHGDVVRVLHPAWSNHPGGATLLGASGLFSFEASPAIDIPKFCDALRLFRLGVSWGGHESLCVPALAALRQSPGVNAMAAFGVPESLVRLHAGLESVEDLWSDLENALAKARR